MNTTELPEGMRVLVLPRQATAARAGQAPVDGWLIARIVAGWHLLDHGVPGPGDQRCNPQEDAVAALDFARQILFHPEDRFPDQPVFAALEELRRNQRV